MQQEKIGKYEIIEQAGSGAAGVVYLARDPDIGRSVAIKVMKAEFFGSPSVRTQAVERFSSEIRAIGRLIHPNIVSIYDSGITADGLPYLVMQFVEGRGLDLILRDLGTAMSPDRALKILKQLASAIDYIHSQKVIHRDLKPSNILIGKNDHVYIVDFSTALFGNENGNQGGKVVGTPQFMAPEVIRGEAYTTSADLYSLGIIAFLLFTGKRPFREGNIADTFSAVLRQSAFSFAELECPLGAKLERVLRRALAKDAEDRYGNAIEFILACEKSLGKVVPDSFSQVAPALDDSEISKSGVFRIQIKDSGRRGSISRFSFLRFILWSALLFIVLSISGLSYVIFALNEDSTINQRVRSHLGIGYTSTDIRAMEDAKLMQLLTRKMPVDVKVAAIMEATQRDTPDLANTVSTTLMDSHPEVRTAAIKAIGLMKSLPPETRDYSFNKGLQDTDPFIRIFSATELVRYQGNRAKDAISKQRELEHDVMVSKILDFILSNLNTAAETRPGKRSAR